MASGAESLNFSILGFLRGWMWPFGCWMKNHLITTTRVFDRHRQSTPYLSVVLWSYSEKYSGQVRYLSQCCSQYSEQIDRLEQTLFPASIPDCLLRPTKSKSIQLSPANFMDYCKENRTCKSKALQIMYDALSNLLPATSLNVKKLRDNN